MDGPEQRGTRIGHLVADRLRVAASDVEGDDNCSLTSSNSSFEQRSTSLNGRVVPAEEGAMDRDGGAKAALKVLLAKQLNEVQQLLEAHHQQALKAAEKMRAESVRRSEAEAAECRQENQRLRNTLSFAGNVMLNEVGAGEVSAGTGESSSTACLPPSPARKKGQPGAGERFKRGPAQKLRFSPTTLQLEREKEREGVASTAEMPLPPQPLSQPSMPSGKPSFLAVDQHRIAPTPKARNVGVWAQPAQTAQNRTSTISSGAFYEEGSSIADEVPSGRNSAIELRRQDARMSGWSALLHTLDLKPHPRPSVGGSAGGRGRKTIRNPNAVFADADEIKQRVRNAICTREYHVFDCYKDAGCFQYLARSQTFELCTLLVILTNALWMSFDTDNNSASVLLDAKFHFQFAEHFFCGYFTIEAIIRFFAFRRTLDACKDAWFVFDSLLVILMITETWVITSMIAITGRRHDDSSLGDAAILKTLRLLRLTRMARVVRLLRACPEVMILIKGIVIAGPSVFFTLVLLVCAIYVFGIAFTELTRGTAAGTAYFGTVPSSMSTLLLHGCFGENLPDVVYLLGEANFLYAALLMVFVLFASLMVMNMLMAALVEVVQVVSSVEKETLVVNFLKSKMQAVIEEMEPDFDGTISRFLFAQLIEHPTIIKALQDVGVDVIELVDFNDYLFDKGDNVNLKEFMEMILQLRGTNKATLKDVIDLRKRLLQEFERIDQQLKQLPLEFPPPQVTLPDCQIVRGPRLPEKDEEEV